MTQNGNGFTVAELTRLLKRRQATYSRLERQKRKLERELAKVEAQMAAISGGRSMRSRLVRKRPKNAKSLRQTIEALLGKSKKGYSLADLVDKILSSGYQSSSSDFKNVVYQCIYNHDGIVHDPESGTYRLK